MGWATGKLPLLVHVGWAMGAHPWVQQDKALGSTGWALPPGSNTGVLGASYLQEQQGREKSRIFVDCFGRKVAGAQ